jgi:hypothetical protein
MDLVVSWHVDFFWKSIGSYLPRRGISVWEYKFEFGIICLADLVLLTLWYARSHLSLSFCSVVGLPF